MITEAEHESLLRVNVAVASISLAASTFLIFCYYRLNIKGFLYRLIFFMTLNDIGLSIGYLIGIQGLRTSRIGHTACQVQGFLITYFLLSSVLWSLMIGYTLHAVFLRGNHNFYSENDRGWSRLRVFLLICQGFPLVMAPLPLATRGWSQAGGWCWIPRGSPAQASLRLFTFYIWIWFAFGYDAWVYISVVRRMPKPVTVQEQFTETTTTNAALTNLKRMRFFPLALVVALFAPSVNRVYEAFAPSWYPLLLLEVIFSSMLGLLNFLAYGCTLSDKVRVYFCPWIFSRGQDPDLVVRLQGEPSYTMEESRVSIWDAKGTVAEGEDELAGGGEFAQG